MRIVPLFLACAFLTSSVLVAAPSPSLTKSVPIDLFREVTSRNVDGLAVRADGVLVPGPSVVPIALSLDADIIWQAIPLAADEWLLTTGPDGRLFSIEIKPDTETATAKPWAKTGASQALVAERLPNGQVLIGTSPFGILLLFGPEGGEPLAKLRLPADSILSLAPLHPTTILVGTGNPGRIFEVDIAKFAAQSQPGPQSLPTAEETPAATEDPDQTETPPPVMVPPPAPPATTAEMADAGITLFAQVRDSNVTQVLVLPDRVVAGSAPDGIIYEFPLTGGSPIIRDENDGSEITALRAGPDGGYYALIVQGGNTSRRSRAQTPQPVPSPQTADNKAATPAPVPATPPPINVPQFRGQSLLAYFPAAGFPDLILQRGGMAFYDLVIRDSWLVLAGGDEGEFLAVDLATRQTLTLPGSDASQILGLKPIAGSDSRYLFWANNIASLGWVDFAPSTARKAKTKKIDLRNFVEVGQLSFGPGARPADLRVMFRSSLGTDEVEGWSPWRELPFENGGWDTNNALARSVQLELLLPAALPTASRVRSPQLFFLPQNRPPSVQSFVVLPPNIAIEPRAKSDPPNRLPATLGQLANASRSSGSDDDKNGILASPISARPGNRAMYWVVSDSDGDDVTVDLDIRPADGEWRTYLRQVRDYAFNLDTRDLAEGRYETRLTLREQAPRKPAQRATVTLLTESFSIDRTAPKVSQAKATRNGATWSITLDVTDLNSRIASITVQANNGYTATFTNPVDGILDERTESFAIEITAPELTGADSLDLIAADVAENTSSTRLRL